MTKEPHELIIYGRVERFSNSPNGNCLRLVDINSNAVWAGDDLLQSFEDKGNICLQIKMIQQTRAKRLLEDTLRWIAIIAVGIAVSVAMFIVSAAILWEYWL